jgi:aspartate aminotransferase-like enzyme
MLLRLGYVIYPASSPDVKCFRVGSMGDLDDAEIDGFLRAVQSVLGRMDVRIDVAV